VEVRTITDYLKQDPEWAKILSMDKNEVLLFIAERLETITDDGARALFGKDNKRRAEALPRSLVIYRPEGEGMFYLREESSVDERGTFKLLPIANGKREL
jgi:hypothetical protein